MLLQLNERQMASMQEATDAVAATRIGRRLRKSLTRELDDKPDFWLQAFCELGIARAREWGMSSERSLQAYISMLLVLGPRFDEDEGVQRVLRDEQVPADARIFRLRTADRRGMEAVGASKREGPNNG